jgi:hypothetical protein
VTEIPLILSLDTAGNPHRWITYEDVAYYEAKDLVLWRQGMDEYALHGGTNRITGQQSKMDINTIVAIRGQMMKSEHFDRYNNPPLTNKALFRRDDCLCAYCGNSFTGPALTRDHVIPTSRGGKNEWSNVVSSCSSCNKLKDNYLLNEISMELLYVPYTPNRAEFLILMNRNILADQMEFLLKRVGKDSRLLQ